MKILFATALLLACGVAAQATYTLSYGPDGGQNIDIIDISDDQVIAFCGADSNGWYTSTWRRGSAAFSFDFLNSHNFKVLKRMNRNGVALVHTSHNNVDNKNYLVFPDHSASELPKNGSIRDLNDAQVWVYKDSPTLVGIHGPGIETHLAIPDGITNAEPHRINNLNEVCGEVYVGTEGLPGVWTSPTDFSYLPLPAGAVRGMAQAITDDRVVGGGVLSASGLAKATVWSREGVPTLLFPDDPARTESYVTSIGAGGEFVATRIPQTGNDGRTIYVGLPGRPMTHFEELCAPHSLDNRYLVRLSRPNSFGQFAFVTHTWYLPTHTVGIASPQFQISGTVSLDRGRLDFPHAPLEVVVRADNGAEKTLFCPVSADGHFALDVECNTRCDVKARMAGTLFRQIGSFAAQTDSADVGPVLLINGDCDGNNVIDIADYTILATAFDAIAGDANWDARTDLNGDGIIDIADYTILALNFDAVGD